MSPISKRTHYKKVQNNIFLLHTKREGGRCVLCVYMNKMNIWEGISIHNLDIHVSADLCYTIGRFQYFM